MKTTFNTLFGAMLLAGSASAFAASSVDLTVTGMITPSACEPTLSRGGVVDYGKISAKDLNADTPTMLEKQTVQLILTCDAATLAAIEAKDNREGSAIIDDPDEFGLGLINGNQKLGSMNLRLFTPVADGATVRTVGSQDNGATWYEEVYLTRDNIVSVAEASSMVPLPFQTWASDVRISPRIAPTNSLTLTNEAAIDGSVTLTVRYL
ncbi:DUF1120 domain-containing protein [Pseudomonas sp. SDO55104_S430]